MLIPPLPCVRYLALLGMLAGTPAAPAWAGPGHDHGDAPVAASRALPRFTAASESFELVGVLDGTRVTLYLDRAADNAPVTGASIDIEIGGRKFTAQPADGGTYRIALASAPAPGAIPVTATIRSDGDADLVAGELDLHDDKRAADLHDHGREWFIGLALAGLAILASLIGALRRNRRKT